MAASSSSSTPPAKRQRTEIEHETIDITIVRAGEFVQLMNVLTAMRKIVLCCAKSMNPTFYEVVIQFGNKRAFSLTPTGPAHTNLNLPLEEIPDSTLYMREWRCHEMQAKKKMIDELNDITKRNYERQLARATREVKTLEAMIAAEPTI